MKTLRFARKIHIQALAVILSLAIPFPSVAQGLESEASMGREIPSTILNPVQLSNLEPSAILQLPTDNLNLPPENTTLSTEAKLNPIVAQNIQALQINVEQKSQNSVPARVEFLSIPPASANTTGQKSRAGESSINEKSSILLSKRIGGLLKGIKKNLEWNKTNVDSNPDPKKDEPQEIKAEINSSSTKPAELAPFVPVSKKVGELQELARKNPSEAWAKATAILNDSSDNSFVVKSAALDILETAPVAVYFPVLINLLQETDQRLLEREMIKVLGTHSADLSPDQKNQAIEILKSIENPNERIERLSAPLPETPAINQTPLTYSTYQSQKQSEDKAANEARKLEINRALSERSVFNMAQWALAELGDAQTANDIPEKKSVPSKKTGPKKKHPGASLWRLLSSKILTAVLLSFLALEVFTLASHHHLASANISQPEPIAQIYSAPHSGIVQAPAIKPAQESKPKVETQSDQLNQIEKNTGSMAASLARLSASTQKPQSSILSLLKSLLLMTLVFVAGSLILSKILRGMQGGGGVLPKTQKFESKTEKPSARFSDIGGIDESLVEVQEIADYLRNPKKWVRAGATPPKGVLLVGPPGTGKTLLAKALAGETDASFISVTGSEFVEKFVGVGASRIRDLFEEARNHKPMIIFIDEIDAIGKARDASNNDGGNSERDQTLNQLLTEMDGFDGSNGVIIMAATNRDDVLDPALTRPGRFDRKIYVGNPDALGRKAVLAIHAAKASLHHDININHIVRRTTGFSGAGLMGIIEEAKRLAVRRNDTSVSPEDINEAISKMKVGVARNLALSPEGKRRTAYHESGHSLSKVFAGGAIDNAVTIIPRGESLGHAEPAPEDNDVFLLTKTQLKTRIIQAMGGRAAEELVFGETSTGPENDIEQAEYYARLMVGKLGMSDEVGLLTSAGKDDRFGTRRISEQTAREMDVAVNKILKEGLETAKESLKTHRAELDAMAHALIERETIYKEDIEKIVHRSAP